MRIIEVQTDRLLIIPRTLEEMKTLQTNEPNLDMKQAYQEMMDEMVRNTGREEWSADWNIMLKSNGVTVGGIGFKGIPDRDGMVEIGYGIDETYRRNGYATEAVAALLQWAFSFPEVNKVLGETDPENEISKKVLQNNGFEYVRQGKEGPLFEISKHMMKI